MRFPYYVIKGHEKFLCVVHGCMGPNIQPSAHTMQEDFPWVIPTEVDKWTTKYSVFPTNKDKKKPNKNVELTIWGALKTNGLRHRVQRQALH